MKLEFRQTVTCNHLTLARVCKTIDWQQPLPRCGEYVTGLDTLDGEQELQVHKLLHRTQDGSCLAELPGFNIAQLRISYRELEQLAEKRAGRCKSCKNLNFPLAFWPIRAIIIRQSFPRPLDGVADIEGCDGHIH